MPNSLDSNFSKRQIQLGLHLDDEKNHLVSDFVEMRDRLSDVDRQGYHYRVFKASHYASKMEILPYDQWAPMSADHHYLNGVGRQYMAESDEKEIVDVSINTYVPHIRTHASYACTHAISRLVYEP